MKVLILACLIVAASAFPRSPLGSEKCTWGPAYWCKNYQQATECNAIEHCKTHAWKSNDLCGDCKSVVDELHSYAQNNGTQILALMNLLCEQLGSVADECKLVVELYGQTVLKTILELTADSEKLCQELDLCPKSRMAIQHTIMKVVLKQIKSNPKFQNLKSVKSDDYCEDCKLVFAEIKDVLNDKDLENDIIAILEKLCAELGSFSSECKSYVDQYAPFVLQEISSMINPEEICAEIGLCSNSTKKVVAAAPLKPAKIASKVFFPMAPGPVLIGPEKPIEANPVHTPKVSVQCAVCEFMMKELDGILGDNATKEEIQQALDELCSLLPSTVRTECQDIVNEYAPEIIQLLLAELQPGQICTDLGLCQSKKGLGRVSHHNNVKVNDEQCNLCELVIKFVESSLESNATEDEVKKALDAGCSLLPAQLKTECDAIVNEYLDELIKLILQKHSPQEICQDIGLCAAGGKNYVKNKCFLGESYWCASYENALKCEALNHCNFIA